MTHSQCVRPIERLPRGAATPARNAGDSAAPVPSSDPMEHRASFPSPLLCTASSPNPVCFTVADIQPSSWSICTVSTATNQRKDRPVLSDTQRKIAAATGLTLHYLSVSRPPTPGGLEDKINLGTFDTRVEARSGEARSQKRQLCHEGLPKLFFSPYTPWVARCLL